jgi:hypothetical protein
MMSNARHIICLLSIAGLPLIGSPAFVRASGPQTGSVSIVQDQVFTDVQNGITGGSASLFSRHFAPQVYIQLPETDGAHYSAKQAFYVLDLYLHDRKAVAIRLIPYGVSSQNPYASGQVTFMYRGVRQDSRIYVALVLKGDRWMISHLSIR